jgi:hypothetical protein
MFCLVSRILSFSLSFVQVAMPFLRKQPCTVSRVLSIADIPPHDVPHSHCEYAYYYDPLYFPQYHASIFDDKDNTCSWLQLGFEKHVRDCLSCDVPRFPPNGVLLVQYMRGSFMLSTAGQDLYLAVEAIESPSFTFCRSSRLLSIRALPVAVWNQTVQNVLSELPPWFFCSDDHYTLSLASVSRRDLCQAACFIGASPHIRKAEFIWYLLHDFLLQRTVAKRHANPKWCRQP